MLYMDGTDEFNIRVYKEKVEDLTALLEESEKAKHHASAEKCEAELKVSAFYYLFLLRS